MKCPKCGHNLPEGKLFCEKCGEEINIVPDYEPETDLSIDLDVFKKTRDIDTKEVKRKLEKSQKSQKPHASTNSSSKGNKKPLPKRNFDDFEDEDDSYWDNDESNSGNIGDLILNIVDFWNKNIVCKIILILAVVAVIVIIIFGVKFVKKFTTSNSYEQYVAMAEEAYKNNNFSDAIENYESAIEKNPSALDLKFKISDCYLKEGQTNNAVFVLKELADEDPSLSEKAYTTIFDIYLAENDYVGINKILQECEDELIKKQFDEYLCRKPTFSYEPGEFDDIINLEIKGAADGTIYYTMDGSDPTMDSDVYTDPLYLQSGLYVIKAIYVSKFGVESEIAQGEYNIKILIPLAPSVSIDSGSYNLPIQIAIETDIGCKTYYTFKRQSDREPLEDPNEESLEYSGPIPMPMGASEFRFVSYNEDGIPSTVITRKYNLTIPDATVTPAEAANIATQYRFSLGGLLDLEGHVTTANGRFLYIIEDAVVIKGNVYYVINEYYEDPLNNNKRKVTGLRYVVNVKNPNDIGELELNANNEFYIIRH